MALLIRSRVLSVHYMSSCSAFLFKRCLSDKKTDHSTDTVKIKYDIFKDEESPIILDVEEELGVLQEKTLIVPREKKVEEFLERGVNGVFEIEELVSFLKKDNARNIFVVKVPESFKYVEYLVIVTGKSRRHILGLAEYIRYIFKKKMNSSDTIPIIEGKDSSDWIAMDLGNIALHIMSTNARVKYDLESLWTLGQEYDLKSIEEDAIIDLIKKHSFSLDDLRPLE